MKGRYTISFIGRVRNGLPLISRGFHGRRRTHVEAARVPPGQYVTKIPGTVGRSHAERAVRPVAVHRGRAVGQSRSLAIAPISRGRSGAAIAARITACSDRGPGGHPATVRRWSAGWTLGPAGGGAAPAGRTPADQPDRDAARAPGPVDAAADPAVPGLAAGQPADAVPAGPAGRDLAAAQADRPRRPRP